MTASGFSLEMTSQTSASLLHGVCAVPTTTTVPDGPATQPTQSRPSSSSSLGVTMLGAEGTRGIPAAGCSRGRGRWCHLAVGACRACWSRTQVGWSARLPTRRSMLDSHSRQPRARFPIASGSKTSREAREVTPRFVAKRTTAWHRAPLSCRGAAESPRKLAGGRSA
eukprot:scaffold58996_cov51-Phaeocystis_antarctica.AAC.2